jgi:hypothetical protein
MVLDEGKICQFGKYRDLVKDRRGMCYQLMTQGQFNDLERERSSVISALSPGKSKSNKRVLTEKSHKKVEFMILEEEEEQEPARKSLKNDDKWDLGYSDNEDEEIRSPLKKMRENEANQILKKQWELDHVSDSEDANDLELDEDFPVHQLEHMDTGDKREI